MPAKKRLPPKKVRGEYWFEIDAYSPTKIPMLRLAEYMQQLAQILGEAAYVHFQRLERGSTIIVHKIEREAIPKVRERVSRMKRGDGPVEAVRAFRATNRLLREDNAVGNLKMGSVVLPFPGRNEAQEEFAAIHQHGFIDGIVTSVGGRDKTAHILLQAEDVQISGCYTSRAVAKQLGARLYESVRLHGRGRWRRDSEGTWSLIDFKVESFEPLDDAPLADVLTKLREIPAEWGDNGYSALEMIRHGPKGKGNGGH